MDLASCGAEVRFEGGIGSREESACQSDAVERLASFGAGGRNVVRELLLSPSPWRRHLGAEAIRQVQPAGYDDVVPALLEAYRTYGDDNVLEAMMGVHDPRIVPVLLELVSEPCGRRPSIAMAPLSEMGALATPALPRLREIATSHWDGALRQEAARAYGKISGTPLGPAPHRCPVAIRRDPPGVALFGEATWTVTLHDSVVALSSGPAHPRALLEPVCPKDDSSFGEFALPVGADCFVSRVGFECRSRLDVWRDGKQKALAAGGGPLVRRENDVVAFDMCAHMGGFWGVNSLSRAPNGDWSVRPLASTPHGELLAYAVNPSSIDLLVIPGDTQALEMPCPTRLDGVKGVTLGGTLVLLHVEADGAVTERE